MNRRAVNPLRSPAGLKGRKIGLVLGLLAVGALAACKGSAPTGQVVAVVNGQEVTGQDLAAEARATGVQAGQTPQQVLQRVVARVLLAQSAHAHGLDTYPGYPSDVARLQQDFLAQKALKVAVKPPAKPTPAAVAGFVESHPYMFRDRVQLQADEIKFQSADDMKSLAGSATMSSVASRLQSLNVPFSRQTRTIDTAEIPPGLAEKFLSVPAGSIFFVRDGDIVLAMQIQGRQSVAMPPEQQNAVASQVMSRVSTEEQVNAEVKRLRTAAKITYQSGYAPPAAPKPGAAPAPASPQG